MMSLPGQSRDVLRRAGTCLCVCAICRKEWENAASAQGADFKIGDMVGTIKEDILRRAKSLHDTLFGAVRRGNEAGHLATRRWHACPCKCPQARGQSSQKWQDKRGTGRSQEVWAFALCVMVASSMHAFAASQAGTQVGKGSKRGRESAGKGSSGKGDSDGQRSKKHKGAKKLENVKCFKCQGFGHYAKDCPK